MKPDDLARGALILVAQDNYGRAGLWTIAAAWALGRKRRIDHLGYSALVGFWRGQPYLLSFREAV